MYKLSSSKDHQQSTVVKYLQNNNLVMIKASKVQPTSLLQAQSRLILDFTVRENHDDNTNWAAIEQNLKQIFEEIVSCQMMPSCILKINIFILNKYKKIESAIINASWICCMLHGVPLTKSIWHFQWLNKNNQQNKCLLNLNDPSDIISAEYSSIIPMEIYDECKRYKQFITARLQQIFLQ